MAKLVKTFIGSLGGMAAKITGGEEMTEERADSGTVADVDDASSCNSAKSPELSSKLSLSSGEDDRETAGDSSECPVARGYLSKWTNYLHGWQERYVVVAEGILSYFKTECDTQFGCRGSISLHQVKLLLHEFDDLRFDIRVHDCTYFFRASSREERISWTEAVEGNRRYLGESGFAVSTIRRQPSILSLSAISQASTSSFKLGHDFHTKLAEIETYRDILCRQVDTLQAYFDSLAENNSSAAKYNGDNQSSESFERLSEEDVVSDSDLPRVTSTPNSPFPRPSNPTPSKFSTLPPPTSHPSPVSPLTHRSVQNPKAGGHRRTGSDPFSFTKPLSTRATAYHPHLKGTLYHPPINPGSVDFRGEALTFKATTAGIITSLSHCIEAMMKREEYWQRKFDREEDKRRRAEVAAHAALNGPRIRAYKYAGPDFEEGPHSALNEEEFFDALEMAYQSEEMDEERQRRGDSKKDDDHLKTPERVPEERGKDLSGSACDESLDTPTKSGVEGSTSEPSRTEEAPREEDPAMRAVVASSMAEASCPEEIEHKSLTGVTHRLTPLVGERISQYACYLFEEVDNNWSVVHEDGEMKVYRRELEEGGVVIDPLKSYCTAGGVSAREMTSYFFEYDTRMEWESTIESATILETLAEDTIIFHQLHKRVWPSTQRETVFCSHICTLPNAPREENQVGHTWMVGNFSVDHPKAPSSSKLIRATFQVGLVCQTLANRPVEPGTEAQLNRSDISCRLLYATNVNPGGWAPPAVVRTIGKREITKFLKKFSSMAQKKTASTPLSL